MNVKPRMVFFQWTHATTHDIVRVHMQQHVKCLGHFFDVTVIGRDCDYAQVCDEIRPDIALFEAGVRYDESRRLRIRNTNVNPGVLKLGLHNGDPWCDCRAGFISDMEHWGIDEFVTIAVGTAEHTPEIAHRLFVWPNAIDPEIFRDYGASKSIPVMMTGVVGSLYPWRRKIGRLLADHYPSLVCPHPGYGSAHRVLAWHGEEYARMIGAAAFVPACGTVANELLRKHLEIPACRTCLVTEWSPALAAAGFVDMENCVFVDETCVLDKVDALLRDRERLQEITDAGFRHVHARHTIAQRDQLLQWYQLSRRRTADERVVQRGPFERLELVARSEMSSNVHVSGNGRHLALLAAGDEKLRLGDVMGAQTSYLQSLNYIPWMPEPMLRLAICALHQGDAGGALEWLRRPLSRTLDTYHASDPDPVEWAYSILALLCCGNVADAVHRADQFSSLVHPELERARWLARALNAGVVQPPPDPSTLVGARASLHSLPHRDQAEWVRHVVRLLVACGQQAAARRIMGERLVPIPEVETQNDVTTADVDLPSRLSFARLSALLGRFRATRAIKAQGRRWLAALEGRFGPFLPYEWSDFQHRLVHYDEFYSEIRILARDEDFSSAALVGAAAGQGITEAFLAGAASNPRWSAIALINRETVEFRRLRDRRESSPNCRWMLVEKVDGRADIGRTMRLSGLTAVDALLMDGSQFGEEVFDALLEPPKVVVIEHINNVQGARAHRRMLADGGFELQSHNPDYRHGYSFFRRREPYSPARIDRAGSTSLDREHSVSSVQPRQLAGRSQ
jgi:hypothetical protein